MELLVLLTVTVTVADVTFFSFVMKWLMDKIWQYS